MTGFHYWLQALIGILLIAPGACSFHAAKKASPEAEPNSGNYLDLTTEARLWADSICGLMTLDEKLGQMLMPALFSRTDAATLNSVNWYANNLKVGGILLLKGEAEAAAQIADSLEAYRSRQSHSPGMYLAVDAETGLGMRFSDAPLFPWLSEISRHADEGTFYDYGREVAREAQIAGINMILGPVIDVNRLEERQGIMRRRSLGSDQLRVAQLSLAYASGLESQDIASVVKHFPGLGSTISDTHKTLATINTSADELYGIDLLPFKKAVQNGVSCVMVGHVWAPALDSVKRPASFSPVIIQKLLRDEMNFKGLVIVDALGMGGAQGFTSADAIKAGADIILAPLDTKKELSTLREAVSTGTLNEERINESCRRILFHKYIHSIHNSDRLSEKSSSKNNIKEHLSKEAPNIIDRLNGFSQ